LFRSISIINIIDLLATEYSTPTPEHESTLCHLDKMTCDEGSWASPPVRCSQQAGDVTGLGMPGHVAARLREPTSPLRITVVNVVDR
jgi:hypothetical protein